MITSKYNLPRKYSWMGKRKTYNTILTSHSWVAALAGWTKTPELEFDLVCYSEEGRLGVVTGWYNTPNKMIDLKQLKTVCEQAGAIFWYTPVSKQPSMWMRYTRMPTGGHLMNDLTMLDPYTVTEEEFWEYFNKINHTHPMWDDWLKVCALYDINRYISITKINNHRDAQLLA